MSRPSLSRPRLRRAVWDRPATDTRLLFSPFPGTVSLSPSIFPHGKTTKPSAPSRHLSPVVTVEPQFPSRLPRIVDARVYARMTSRGSAPHGAFLPAADACPDSPQMFPRLIPLRVSPSAVDACPGSPQMYPHGPTPLRALPSSVDARAPARMISPPAVPGVEVDACAKAQAISHATAPDAPVHAAEGALALPSHLFSLTLSTTVEETH